LANDESRSPPLGETNENSRSSDPSRTGNQFCSGGLSPRERGGQSLSFRAVAASPQLVQQLEAVNLKFDEAFNKHDAAAVGALYIANAVQVTPVGKQLRNISEISFSVSILPIELQK
jgi:hypothetical protein